MKRVVIESPYAGNTELNVRYARACLLDSYLRGEAPIASHLLGPQVLDDNNAEQRRMGIAAGLAWASVAECSVFYIDLGMSDGMVDALERARTERRPYAFRKLDADRLAEVLA